MNGVKLGQEVETIDGRRATITGFADSRDRDNRFMVGLVFLVGDDGEEFVSSMGYIAEVANA